MSTNNENYDLEDERNIEASIENDISNEINNQQPEAIALPIIEDAINNIDLQINIENEQQQLNIDIQNENNDELNGNMIDDFIDDDDDDEDVVDDDNDEEDDNFFVDLINEESSDTDDYYSTDRPNQINFDTALPASHNYLGENFEDVTVPKVVHEQNDLITIPIIALPGTQLLPGQVMPLCIYSSAQINMIKNRLDSTNGGDSTIGFIIRPGMFI